MFFIAQVELFHFQNAPRTVNDYKGKVVFDPNVTPSRTILSKKLEGSQSAIKMGGNKNKKNKTGKPKAVRLSAKDFF